MDTETTSSRIFVQYQATISRTCVWEKQTLHLIYHEVGTSKVFTDRWFRPTAYWPISAFEPRMTRDLGLAGRLPTGSPAPWELDSTGVFRRYSRVLSTSQRPLAAPFVHS